MQSNERQSVDGNHMQSMAIRCQKKQSDAIIRCNQMQSYAIRGSQRPSEAIRGNEWPGKAIRGNQRQPKAIRGNHRRQSSLAIIRGSYWPTSADFGQRLVGRRPVVGQRLGRVEDRHTPSRSPADSCASSLCACRWRRRGRMGGAVVGV